MFDLEARIRDWRREVEAAWNGDKPALDELEDHLREDIAHLTGAGRGDRDAWAAAVANLGDATVLCREFAKINRLPMFDRVAFSAILGTAALIIAAFLTFLISRGQRFVDQPVLTIHIVTITIGYLAGLFASAFAGYTALRAFLAKREIPALAGVALKLIRVSCITAAASSLLGLAFGAVWANGAWGRPLRIDLHEIGALVVVVSFLVASIATVRNAVSAQISLTITIVAGATVVVAWFGVAAHAANYPPLLTAITVVGLAKLCVLAALSLKVRNDAAVR